MTAIAPSPSIIPPRPADPSLARAGAVLTINLDAITQNWRALAARVAPAVCAAVVKADAYGLGAREVARALSAAGCRTFFVAHLDEGIALRHILPSPTRIAVLHGPMPGTEADFTAHHLLPVLNSLEQVAGFAAHAHHLGRKLPAVVQSDTGMSRFGLTLSELTSLVAADALEGLDVVLHMSHLACADTPDHPANGAQRQAFLAARRLLPGVPASLSASSAIFLGGDFHFDLVRPGAALYGIAPQAGAPNPLRPVVRLEGRVVQLRQAAAGTPVGYGHTATTPTAARLATVGMGYADGFLRSLSNTGAAWHRGTRLPLIGRVSMDSIILDISALPDGTLSPGDAVDLIGPDQDLDALARAAGTIGYELLTSLGARYARRYLGG
ncbi:alanine racemase [Xanthobacter agilis]|uniref:Alanine racemase n=1 Tax=Xanthobacter agilis TaxID=47492 RepID=A0ABU0LBL9_XANAG|nr:alanine racemase [Xanthobacter agilis]MDQ0504526.1 alanine racemase [Xanthobacter agilis]